MESRNAPGTTSYMNAGSPLLEAVRSKNIPLAKKLLQGGADPNGSPGEMPPLIQSIEIGNLSFIQLLMRSGADPNVAFKGKIALVYAIESQNDKAKQLLVDAGATIEGVIVDDLDSPVAKIAVKKMQEKGRKISADEFIGQGAAKESLKEIVSMAALNKLRTRQGMGALEVTFHAVFHGAPGTGKTTFARYYAQEICGLGFLSRGHLSEVSRSDLIAGYAGQTAIKTQKVLEQALGGVLLIDEAYSLKSSDDDSYGQECIDTLLKFMEDNREDLIIILAGYSEEMQIFLNLNPGLKSRVPNLVHFVDFTDAELMEVLKTTASKNQVVIQDDALELAIGQIVKEKKGKSFGNARTVRNVFELAIRQQSLRLSNIPPDSMNREMLQTLTYSDFTPDRSDSGTKSEAGIQVKSILIQSNPMAQLDEMVGLTSVKKEISELSDFITISNMRNSGKGIGKINLHMIFSGNPGTGKTAVARVVGEIIRSLGVLSSGHLVEVDRSQLVAGFTGQTAIKTQKVIDEAIGGILFIDEAYALVQGDQDQFGIEAVNTLLKAAEDHRDKLIIILAGYRIEMETFLKTNPGLNSRFNRIIDFEDYTANDLEKIAVLMANQGQFKLSPLALAKIVSLAEARRKIGKDFANARTIRNILEACYKRQASRLVREGNVSGADKARLSIIDEEDVA